MQAASSTPSASTARRALRPDAVRRPDRHRVAVTPTGSTAFAICQSPRSLRPKFRKRYSRVGVRPPGMRRLVANAGSLIASITTRRRQFVSRRFAAEPLTSLLEVRAPNLFVGVDIELYVFRDGRFRPVPGTDQQPLDRRLAHRGRRRQRTASPCAVTRRKLVVSRCAVTSALRSRSSCPPRADPDGESDGRCGDWSSPVDDLPAPLDGLPGQPPRWRRWCYVIGGHRIESKTHGA